MADKVKQSKMCSKCKIVHPVGFFGPSKYVLSGLESQCRDCKNKSKRIRMGILNPSIKRRPKIKCISCKESKPKKYFSVSRQYSLRSKPFCLDCLEKSKKIRTERIKKRYTERSFLSRHRVKRCETCNKCTLCKSPAQVYCSKCSKIVSKDKGNARKKEKLKNNKKVFTDQYYIEIFSSNKTRKCSKCNTIRHISEFGRRYDSPGDGIQKMCKICYGELKSKHYQDNKDKLRIKHRAWKKDNYFRVKLKYKQAKVAWRDTTAIRLIYKEMRRLNREAGYIKYHVDHIIPVHSNLVCGLHVENNLNIILGSDNEKKGNKFIPGKQYIAVSREFLGFIPI